MQKMLYRTGFIAYALLLIMATLFYKERTIFMDAAYHLFHILIRKDFAIQHYRFGAVVTEIFPVIGSKLGLSLKNIMILYSGGTMFFYFLCYFICGTVLKQYRFALCVLFFSILFATETFYWPISELQQGCTMLLVMFALLNSKMQPVMKYLLAGALTITLVFIHPLIIIPASFLFIYFLVSKQSNIGQKELLACLGIFVVAYFLKVHYFTPPYEAATSAQVNKRMVNLIPRYFHLYSVNKFANDCLGKFIWIPVFFILTTVYYILKRKWALLGLYVVSVLGFISLVNLSYDYWGVPSFYIENLYLPLSIILAAPAFFEMADILPNKNIAVAILCIVIATGIFRIYHQRSFYKARVDWLRGFYTENSGKKLIVHSPLTPMGTLIMPWGTSYEFWLISTIEQNKTASIIIADNVDELIPPSGKTKSFITPYGGYPYHTLPEKYFKFTDTVSEYKVLRNVQ